MAASSVTRLRTQIAAALVALIFCGGSLWLSSQEHSAPPRGDLGVFPMQFGQWSGRKGSIEKKIILTLKLDDYLLADFRRPADPAPVNLYVAYNRTQSLGSAAHSPKTCIPGGGWEIEAFGRAAVKRAGAARLPINRAVIAKGRFKQLVYYWFEQRGRTLTNEYHVKWYLLVDAISKNRSDGTLIRLVTPVVGNDMAGAEKRLADFIARFYPRVKPFISS